MTVDRNFQSEMWSQLLIPFDQKSTWRHEYRGPKSSLILEKIRGINTGITNDVRTFGLNKIQVLHHPGTTNHPITIDMQTSLRYMLFYDCTKNPHAPTEVCLAGIENYEEVTPIVRHHQYPFI